MYHRIPILITKKQYQGTEEYYKKDIHILERDTTHVLGYVEINSDKSYDHTDLFIGEQVHAYADMWNLWIDRSGSAYFVPWWGHGMYASVFHGQSVSALEEMGWIHISDSILRNWDMPKVTDRQYDTLVLYCEQNRMPLFRRLVE